MRRVTILLMLLLAAPLAAQPVPYDAAKQVHWATAAFFGTGWYRVSDNRTLRLICMMREVFCSSEH